jgi:hypothetical protein
VTLCGGRRRRVLGPLAIVAVERGRTLLEACVRRPLLDCLVLSLERSKSYIKFVEEASEGAIIEVVYMELSTPAYRLL